MHSLHREAAAAAGGPVCVWSRSINAADLRLPEYNGRVKCAQTIFQSVWPSPAISLSITLSTPSHPSSLNMQQISLSPTHTIRKTSFNPKTKLQISMLIKIKWKCFYWPFPAQVLTMLYSPWDMNVMAQFAVSVLRVWGWWERCGGGKGQGRTIITRDTWHRDIMTSPPMGTSSTPHAVTIKNSPMFWEREEE